MSAANYLTKGPVTHWLKTWPDYFDAIWRGEKRFEIRKNDRDFHVEDYVRLVRFCPRRGKYLHGDEPINQTCADSIIAHIPYILSGGVFGLEEGHVVFSIDPVQKNNSGLWVPDLACDHRLPSPSLCAGRAG